MIPRENAEGSNDLHPFQAIHNALKEITNLQEVLQAPTANEYVRSAIYHLNRVQLEHLGIDSSYVQSLLVGQCMTVFESRHFEIAAFILPAGFKLHLHDHPNMVVCSSLLHGSALIRSYSRAKKRRNGDVDARLEIDMQKTVQDEPWMLTPRHGNYHEITPLTECVMLDILLPPYDDEQRPCNFYEARRKESTSNSDTPNEDRDITNSSNNNGGGSLSSSGNSSNNSSSHNLLLAENGGSSRGSSPRAANSGNYLLRKLSYGEQIAIQLPYAVQYQGYVPN